MTLSPLVGIVDNDADVRTSLADLLRASGYRAACFQSGEDFLGSTDRDECACVLVDIHMPGMSGLELLKRLMPTSDWPPVIIMTGRPEKIWREHALQAGAVGFLKKPFDAERLLRLLAENLPTVSERDSRREKS